LQIKDLAGGKNYEAILMVYPKGQHLVPQQSNILVSFIFVYYYFFQFTLVVVVVVVVAFKAVTGF